MSKCEKEMKCLHCGKNAAEREVQAEGANKERKYYKCGNPTKPECAKFFKWAEQLQVGNRSLVKYKLMTMWHECRLILMVKLFSVSVVTQQ